MCYPIVQTTELTSFQPHADRAPARRVVRLEEHSHHLETHAPSVGVCRVLQQVSVEVRGRALRKMRAADGSAMNAEGIDASLLAMLKSLRLRLAKERQVPAYVVFSDRTLIDMAERRPHDLDAFAEVNGVGAAKLKEFGEVFLAAIARHQSELS